MIRNWHFKQKLFGFFLQKQFWYSIFLVFLCTFASFLKFKRLCLRYIAHHGCRGFFDRINYSKRTNSTIFWFLFVIMHKTNLRHVAQTNHKQPKIFLLTIHKKYDIIKVTYKSDDRVMDNYFFCHAIAENSHRNKISTERSFIVNRRFLCWPFD